MPGIEYARKTRSVRHKITTVGLDYSYSHSNSTVGVITEQPCDIARLHRNRVRREGTALVGNSITPRDPAGAGADVARELDIHLGVSNYPDVARLNQRKLVLDPHREESGIGLAWHVRRIAD